MKTRIKYSVVYISLIISSLIYANSATAQQFAVSFQVFYDQLSPYGQWVDYPNYGYVWMPDAGPGFTPYSTNGYWIMTNYGMTWVSNYSWGWAPFHYGRWEFDNFYGWFWVPDTEWGPAWVTWRRSSGYYGWAPMRPGISITVSFGSHYHHHHDHWVFVRYRDIDRHDLYRCYVNRREHSRIIRNSRVINNTYIDNSRHVTYVAGPDRRDLQRNLGRSVRTATVYENNRPGQSIRNNRLNIYRPRITKSNSRNQQVVPRKYSRITDMKRNSDRNSRTKQSNTDVTNNLSRNNRQYTNRINTNKSTNNRNRQQTTNQSNETRKRQQMNNTQKNRNTNNKVNSSRNNNSRQQKTINRSTNNQRKSNTGRSTRKR